MRAEFFRRGDQDRVVGAAEWDGRQAVVQADDLDMRLRLRRVFRPSPVAIDDPASRPPGASGETVVEPGDLEWFRAAARIRAGREGLAVRFVTDVAGRWDPALDPQTYGWGGSKPALPPR
jgi:hypothetical protein